MQFVNVAELVDSYVTAEAFKQPFKNASICLFVVNKAPLEFEDASHISLSVSAEDLKTHSNHFQRMREKTSLNLEDVSVSFEMDEKSKDSIKLPKKCEIISTSVTIDFGEEKVTKLKNFTIKLSVIACSEKLILLPNTRGILRRMQKAELVKKAKPTKLDIVNFIGKGSKKIQEQEKNQLMSGVPSLDSQSIDILQTLVKFVNKQDIFRTLLNKELNNRRSKRLVRLTLVPTDVSNGAEEMSIVKKKFKRNTILELISEYEAREEAIKL